MNRLAILGATGALLMSLPALAHDPSQPDRPHTHWWLEMDPDWYVGAALAQNSFDEWSFAGILDDGSYTARAMDDRDVGFRAFAGVTLPPYFALEAGYADFGEAAFATQSDGSGSRWAAGPVTDSLALDGFELNLLGRLPLFGDVAATARVGTLLWQSDYRFSGNAQFGGPFAFNDRDNDVSGSYGAGLEYTGLPSLRLSALYALRSFDPPGLGFGPDGELESIEISASYLF